MISPGVKVERTVSARVMATYEELHTAVAASKTELRPMTDYPSEVPVFLKETAGRAQAFGRELCSRAQCRLECAGIDLVDTITPQSRIDGVLTAQCIVADCDAPTVISHVDKFFQVSITDI